MTRSEIPRSVGQGAKSGGGGAVAREDDMETVTKRCWHLRAVHDQRCRPKQCVEAFVVHEGADRADDDVVLQADTEKRARLPGSQSLLEKRAFDSVRDDRDPVGRDAALEEFIDHRLAQSHHGVCRAGELGFARGHHPRFLRGRLRRASLPPSGAEATQVFSISPRTSRTQGKPGLCGDRLGDESVVVVRGGMDDMRPELVHQLQSPLHLGEESLFLRLRQPAREGAHVSDAIDHVLIGRQWVPDHHGVPGTRHSDRFDAPTAQRCEDAMRAQRVPRLRVRQ